ncbi:hypothetical protein [Phenylobacterium sp. RIFCSPHIGHO2_01_FULL_69_31]|uniref:hypothetical protein n=1 Tax=Phenylobacterium sp. RIFCSPHIGHO2_01_FULL_69_31 TaxID=1801944 RepID=UPI0025DE4FFB|nr:hypothetical protein [Phenylobacterium sp. RIFCSPHIGHO2_01_FULL_69_31]
MSTYTLAFIITAATMFAVGLSPLAGLLPTWAWPWGLLPYFWAVFILLAWFRKAPDGGKQK